MASKFDLSLLKGLLSEKGATGPRTDSSRSVKWVDGLRGLASFSVITSHLARAFDYDLFIPSDTPEAPIRLFQWPYLRLWPQGRIGVAIFALLTGFVCGIKPIKQIRAGDPQAALSTLGKAAFKRPMRLMLPGTFGTLFAFVVCQLGLFSIAGKVDAEWIRKATPQPGTFNQELWRLERNWRGVWTNGHNDYDDHQWTLLPLLKCSMFIYFTLTALATVQFKYRIATYLIFFSYYWQDPRPETETFYCHAFYGVLLSDLSQHRPFQELVQSKHIARRVISVFLILAGLYIASYPMDHEDWKEWPMTIKRLEWLFPEGLANMPKRFTSVGLIMTVFGIVLNNTARAFLCTRPIQFMGKHSFAVYLTHGTILKTVLMWMIYGISGKQEKDEEGNLIPIPRCSLPGFFFWVPIWLVLVYGIAWLWTTYIDTLCEHISQWVMRKCFEPTEKAPTPANMA